jgi:hypothetical protein
MTKYDYNEDFFDEIAEPQGWVLGWISSDGHVRKDTNEIILNLQTSDVYILEQIGLLLRNDKKVLYNNNYNKVGIYLCNKKLRNDVIDLGIPAGKKSDIIEPLDLPKKAIPAFWQGMFEGDGTIYYHKGDSAYHMKLTGNKYMCRGFREYFGFGAGGLSRDHNSYQTEIYLGRKRFPNIYNSLYCEYNLQNNLFLKRKHQKFMDCFNNFNT